MEHREGKRAEIATGRQTRLAKKAVATNKALAMNELYEELETPEGERNICGIAKARYKATKDFTKNNQIIVFKGPG